MEAEYIETGLRQLKVRPGTALQTRCQSPDSQQEEALFLAAIEGKGVMLSHPGGITLTVGSDYHVCGFTGQHDFYFTARVLQIFDSPFDYAMLAYPESVKARKVRQATRMKVRLPALVCPQGATVMTPVNILDLSIFGAMFQTPVALGTTGGIIQINVEFMLEAKPVRLSLASSIRHSQQADNGGYFVGVAFKDATSNDKLLLHYLAYTATQQDPV